MTTGTMRLLQSALIAVVLTVALPAAAQAADVSVSGATLSFTAGDNEANNVSVALAAAGANVTAGAGCSQSGANAVTCPQGSINLQGPAGPKGQTGATGATGPAGKPGRDAIVTCVPKGKGTKIKVVCTVKLAAAARASVRAVFSRGRHVVATASGVRRSNGRIALRGHRRLARGRYTLTLTFRAKGHRTTVSQRVRVA